LAWAVEHASPEECPIICQKWLALRPEERWWLYTQTAAATGHGLDGRGRGWRRALRYALTENPAHDPFGDTRARLVLRQQFVPTQTSQDDVSNNT
jgi:hypothetical protein